MSKPMLVFLLFLILFNKWHVVWGIHKLCGKISSQTIQQCTSAFWSIYAKNKTFQHFVWRWTEPKTSHFKKIIYFLSVIYKHETTQKKCVQETKCSILLAFPNFFLFTSVVNNQPVLLLCCISLILYFLFGLHFFMLLL